MINTTSLTVFRVIILRLPAPLIAVSIAFLSSRSTLPGSQLFPGVDKLMHFTAFSALAAAAGLWFSRESWLQPGVRGAMRNFIICAAIASVYGALDEFHQYFVPGRSSDVWDWVADTLGGMAGAAAALLAIRKFTVMKNQ